MIEQHLSDRIKTPRGEFKVYNGTWADFQNEDDVKDWGLWFEHRTDDTQYEIMHNSKKQHAIAVVYKSLHESITKSCEDDQLYDLKLATPYMLRNDGKLIECSPMHPYIKFIFESDKDALQKLSADRFYALEWFYNNTNEKNIKNSISIIVKYLLNKGIINEEKVLPFDIKDDTYSCSDAEIGDFLNILNADTNQEFLRVRTSNLLFGGTDNSIYFRISSIRFNWFDIIWQLVYKYHNDITNITICKDSNTFGGRFTPYIVYGEKVYNMPTDEFINLKGNPIIESSQKPKNLDAIENSNNKLKLGKIISESYDYLHPRYTYGFYQKQVKDYLKEDIYGILSKKLNEKLIQSDSDAAFKKNIETELKAGKPRKQALAIAYSIKEKKQDERRFK